jgi:hypothetical protein
LPNRPDSGDNSVSRREYEIQTNAVSRREVTV